MHFLKSNFQCYPILCITTLWKCSACWTISCINVIIIKCIFYGRRKWDLACRVRVKCKNIFAMYSSLSNFSDSLNLSRYLFFCCNRGETHGTRILIAIFFERDIKSEWLSLFFFCSICVSNRFWNFSKEDSMYLKCVRVKEVF